MQELCNRYERYICRVDRGTSAFCALSVLFCVIAVPLQSTVSAQASANTLNHWDFCRTHLFVLAFVITVRRKRLNHFPSGVAHLQACRSGSTSAKSAAHGKAAGSLVLGGHPLGVSLTSAQWS